MENIQSIAIQFNNSHQNPTINISEFQSFFEHCGSLFFGAGKGQGGNRALDASQAAVKNFNFVNVTDGETDGLKTTIESQSIANNKIQLKEAKRILVCISGNKIELEEIGSVARVVRDSANQDADMWYGQFIDKSLDGDIAVLIVATDKEYLKVKK